MATYNDAVRHALAIAVLVSPTGREQEAFGQMVNAMYDDGLSEKRILSDLLGAISDGIRYNNWPRVEQR